MIFISNILSLYYPKSNVITPQKNVTLYSKCPIYIHLNVALLCGYNGREKAKVNWFVFVRDVIRMRRHHSESSLWGLKWHTRTMTASLKRALKTHFGFENFRSKLQEDVVKAVVKGELANWLSTCRLSSSFDVSGFLLAKTWHRYFDNGGAPGDAVVTFVVVRQVTGMCSCACQREQGSLSATSCLRSRLRASLWSSRLSSLSFRSVAH